MFYSCLLYYSLLNGIDPRITQAIISVESGGNSMAISADLQDFGIMQIRKKFHSFSSLQLLQPCTNIKLGVEILKKAKDSCKHTIDNTWIICYNLGRVGGARIKHPKKWEYYKKVMASYGQKT